MKLLVRVIAKKALRAFWESKPECADARAPLQAWYREATQAHWNSPAAIKDRHRNASFVANNRVIFNIAGNKYRLIVKINYSRQVIYVRFVGTHAEYDRIDAETV